MAKKLPKILWLDDNPRSIKIYVEELEEKGYEVNIAETFSEAKTALQPDNFSLIIIDLIILPVNEDEEKRYPGSNDRGGTRGGLVFYKLMKEEKLLEPSKVIVYTINYEAEIHKEFIAAGLPEKHFVTKSEYKFAHEFAKKVEEILHNIPKI